MARILTGIQSTGVPHLGNLLGAILPGIELASNPDNEAFFFMADFHSLTTIHNPDLLSHNTYATAAAWLACGLDTEKNCFYRQSDIPEVTELTWYLSCFIPYTRLALAHSFKDKQDKLDDVYGGLFFYPVLMAADILLYDAEIIPVGKDQKQHIEITRDIASRFNNNYGETLRLPEAQIKEDVAVVPGIKKSAEGEFVKMSKSYGNTINIFEPDDKLWKRLKKIQSESIPQEAPKDPDTDLTFAYYKLIATPEQTAELRKLYEAGGLGFGDAKRMLLELIQTRFKDAREKFNYFMENKAEIDQQLNIGAEKAGAIAYDVLSRVRERVGYKKYAY